MQKLLCSTGCICTRSNGRDHTVIGRLFPQLDCDGLEFMMFGSWYDIWETVLRDMRSYGINIPVLHVDKRLGERITLGEAAEARALFRINCEMAAGLGADKLVMHLWDGLPSDGNIAANMAEYAVLRDIAAGYGLVLTVENVVCVNSTPLDHLRTLREMYPDIAFTYDFKMAQFHSQVDATFAPENDWLWQSAVRHVHFSDYAGGHMEWSALRSLHPGEGNVDFARICAELKKRGYDGCMTIESSSVQPDGTVAVEKLNRSLGFIKSLC